MLQGIGNNRLINGYGPTENTTFTCCHVMRADTRIEHTVPIGRPISNTRVYILDAHLQPVPLGVYGELYIGGDGLAREYLHQPELTREKFVPDPFGTEPGARLYRTGDLVRYLADGDDRVPGARGQPGEDPRLPHRAGGDRSGIEPAPRGARGGGAGARGLTRRQAPGGLCAWRTRSRRPRIWPRSCATTCARACPATWCLRPSCCWTQLPLTPNGQGRSQGAAGAGAHGP